MHKYETIIIINPNADEDTVKALTDRYSDMINKEGKIEKVDNVGKKKLAYEVKKNSEGIYVVFYYEANPSLISELERNFRITDNVIKYLTINVTEK